MRRHATGILLASLFALPATAARAQSTAWRDRGYVAIGGWYQPISTTFTDRIHPIIDVEPSDIDTSYNTRSAAGFDVGGGVRIWRNLAIGAGVSRFATSSSATIDARVPHPFFFSRPRTVSGTAEGVTRDETAVHLRALWMLALRQRWQIGVAAGPSWFSVGQDLVSTIAVTQSFPFDTATFASATSARQTGAGAGFNVRGDVDYMLRPHLGVGVEVSVSRARVPVNDTVTVDAGGAHIGGGLRFRF
jgi:hypothetical protein